MAYPISIKTHTQEFERFARYALVGAVSTLVDFGTLLVLTEVAGLPLVLANSLSFSTGVANSFTLNRLWTYPDARCKAAWVQLGQFVAVSGVGLLLNSAIVGLLGAPISALTGHSLAGTLAAKAAATLIVPGWNFAANRYWTFSDARPARMEENHGNCSQ